MRRNRIGSRDCSTSTAARRRSPPRHDDPQRRAADGHRHPHAVQLSRPAALRRLPRVPGRDRNAARRRSWSPRAAIRSKTTLGRPYRNRERSTSRGRRFWSCCWPRPPTRANWPSSPPELGVTSTPFEPAAEGKCILCGLCARVCNEMMGRGAINLFGRGAAAAKSRTAFGEQTDQCQACGAVQFRLSHRRDRPGAPSPPGGRKPHVTGFDKYLDRTALHRPGPSPGLAARAGHRPRNCVHFKTGAVRAVRQGLPGRRHRLRASRKRRSNWTWAAWCSRPASRPSTPRARGEFGFGFAPERADQRAVRADALGLRPHAGTRPPAQRRQARPSGWPSSSASARATRAATTTIARRSAAWPPPRRPSWPRNTSRAWK